MLRLWSGFAVRPRLVDPDKENTISYPSSDTVVLLGWRSSRRAVDSLRSTSRSAGQRLGLTFVLKMLCPSSFFIQSLLGNEEMPSFMSHTHSKHLFPQVCWDSLEDTYTGRLFSLMIGSDTPNICSLGFTYHCALKICNNWCSSMLKRYEMSQIRVQEIRSSI